MMGCVCVCVCVFFPIVGYGCHSVVTAVVGEVIFFIILMSSLYYFN